MSIRTIPRRTREHAAVISGAYDVKAYALGSCFIGEPVPAHVLTAYCNGSGLIGKMGKLTTDGSPRFKLHVHSNLWFEFSSSAPAI